MTDRRPPLPLLLTVVVALLEALALLVWGVLMLAKVTSSHSAMSAVAGGVFFVLCAAGIGAGAYALWRLHSAARAPMVLVQLIVLGVAWSSRHEVALAVALAVVALVALGGVLAPASIAALDQHDQHDGES